MNTDKWTSQTDKTTQAFRDAFAHMGAEALNWKPNPKTWSVGQNIDHLIVTNATYFPLMAAVHEGSYNPPFTARAGFLVNFFGKLVLNSVEPTRKRKIKTFPIWEPTTSAVPGDVLSRFMQQQETLKQMIRNSNDLLDKGTIIASPANRMIVYKLETAFDILVSHELRHLEQAKEVAALQKK